MPLALDFYQKSLKTVSEGDAKMKGILNFQIGFLLLEQSFYKEAIPYFKNSLAMEKLLNDSLMTAYVLQKIAYAYQEEKNDSCLIYYNMALRIAKETGNKGLNDEILSSLATYYIDCRNYSKAKSYAMPIISHMDPDDPAMASFLYVAATAFRMLGERGSSAYYYHRLGELKSIEAKTEAYLNLFKIYRTGNNADKAFEYFINPPPKKKYIYIYG